MRSHSSEALVTDLTGKKAGALHVSVGSEVHDGQSCCLCIADGSASQPGAVLPAPPTPAPGQCLDRFLLITGA